MGGTAIGTGLNAPRGFAKNTARHLAKLTKKPFAPRRSDRRHLEPARFRRLCRRAARSRRHALEDRGDLILLSSGPRAGLNELELPPLQPGSSIMPGR
jgi:aspartate ammonia-lyase